MQCPTCGSTDNTEITINLQSDNAVVFHACRACEAKWWETAGQVITLDAVLDLTATRKP